MSLPSNNQNLYTYDTSRTLKSKPTADIIISILLKFHLLKELKTGRKIFSIEIEVNDIKSQE